MAGSVSTLALPDRLDIENVLRFARQVDDFDKAEILQIKFGPQRWFPPFSMLFIGAKIKEFKNKNPLTHVYLKEYQDHTYPAHMGLFKLCGIDFGKNVGEAHGSARYLPITQVRREDLIDNPSDQYVEMGDLIQRHVDRIACLLIQDDSCRSEIFHALSYSLREIFRNAFEHSNSNCLYYAAQYWPKNQKVEFCVVDLGIGIKNSLAENPNFRFVDDKEAIEHSLMPGVSGKTHLPRKSENWFNSGYGLYMTNRLARNGGSFLIASGRKAIRLTSATKYNFDTSFEGTAININLNISMIESVQKKLSHFREDALKMAFLKRGQLSRPPSAMSLLLRRDFR